MPRKLLPHVERFRDRHGKMRYYFRRGKGPRLALPDDPGSVAFLEAWKACLDGILPKTKKASDPNLPGSISALIASYRQSSAFVSLKASSKLGYNSRLERLRRDHGNRLVSEMDRTAIKTKVLQPFASQPGAEHDTLKKLRILIRHAIDIGWLDRDPSIKIKRAKLKEIRSWSDAEIAAFEARWPVGTKQRTAFALYLYTGQRTSDVYRMTWADIDEGTIRVAVEKTGAKLNILLASELREVLAKASRTHMTIINTVYGQPYTKGGFSGWFRDTMTAAGLPKTGCKPHGLRKAAGRRLAEVGCSANEIMAVLGHKTLAEAERYTRDANQPRQAQAAIMRLEDRRRTNLPKPSFAGLGELTNKKGNSE